MVQWQLALQPWNLTKSDRPPPNETTSRQITSEQGYARRPNEGLLSLKAVELVLLGLLQSIGYFVTFPRVSHQFWNLRPRVSPFRVPKKSLLRKRKRKREPFRRKFARCRVPLSH